MSVVSSVILQMSVCECAFEGELEIRPGLVELTAWLEIRGFQPLAELQERMSGSKHPQTYVFGAGYNHFPEDEFAGFIMGMKWGYPENVVLVIQPEDGRTRIWRPVVTSTD